jgi:hypothetical protein
MPCKSNLSSGTSHFVLRGDSARTWCWRVCVGWSEHVYFMPICLWPRQLHDILLSSWRSSSLVHVLDIRTCLLFAPIHDPWIPHKLKPIFRCFSIPFVLWCWWLAGMSAGHCPVCNGVDQRNSSTLAVKETKRGTIYIVLLEMGVDWCYLTESMCVRTQFMPRVVKLDNFLFKAKIRSSSFFSNRYVV